ncbi:MAG: isochorismatase family protein [Armatimonadota bacterium]|nr:isochorismatase family protein [Armatimonadota bacterium]MDR7534473.1 isochorismatase family protein [Armatimonadota bacterium]MDR7535782.1 isochorismatase family protein [Armatimonadota bacterium]
MAIWDDVVPPEERALYEGGGWGGIMGFGRRPALLVVDMYTAFVDPAFPFSSPDAPAAVAAIRQVLHQARASGVPVIFSKADRPRNVAERGRWKGTTRLHPTMSRPEAYEIVADLAPLPGETVLIKAAASAFHGTNLASLLVVYGVDTVIVTGTVTSGCVRATVVDASAYGFIPVVPIECVYDRGRTSHKVALWDIHTRYGDVLPTADVLAYLRTVRDGTAPVPVDHGRHPIGASQLPGAR